MRPIARLLLPLSLLLGSTSALAQAADLRPKLEALSETGNAQASYYLGMLYHLGRDGVPKDPKKALELFTKAAEGGDPLAAHRLGDYYMGNPKSVVAEDRELALRHKLKAAEAGYSSAQHDVAQIFYEKGEVAEALRWLEEAAKQGHAPSLQALSSLYSGEGKVEKHQGRSLAYLLLLYSTAKNKPSQKIQAWIKETQAKLSPEETKEADRIISSFTVRPTPLTLRAMAGEAEAKKLAATAPAPAPAAAETPSPAATAEAPAAEEQAAVNEPE